MKRHYIAIAIILLAIGSAQAALRAQQARAGMSAMPESISQIPSQIGDFRQLGADEGVDEHTKAYLETSSILIRNYVNSKGWPVQLTIVYAGSTRRSLHFPEVCLVGEGNEIREQTVMPVGFLFDAKRLVLSNSENQQAVLYWFKTGETMTGNYFLNALYWAQGQVLFQAPNSAMIKLATIIGPGGDEAAFLTLQDFALKLQPVLTEHVP